MIRLSLQRFRAAGDQAWYVAATLAYVVALTAVNVGFASEFHSLALYSVAVAFAGATCTVVWTAVILATSLGAAISITIVYETWTARSGALVIALVLVSIVAIFGSRLRTRDSTELARTRLIADITRTAILRPINRRIGDIEVGSLYLPSERDTTVGGDLFEGVDTRFGTRLLIGDVRGKGLTAFSDAAATLAAFRVMAHETQGLAALAHRLDRHLAEAQQPADVEPRFVTALLVEFPPGAREARVISCGHPPPLLHPAGGEPRIIEIAAPSLPLNLGVLLPDAPPQAVVVPFAVGDRLLLYTDGVTEARDDAGRFYPLVQRYPAAIDGVYPALTTLREDLVGYAHSLRDDVAIVLAQRMTTTSPEGATLADAEP
jgi:hypothetical protein